MINELIKLATHLDGKGYHREANYIDKMLKLSNDKEEYGELIDLGERRRMLEETEQNKKWQEPEKLMEDYSEIQNLLDELQNSEGANIELAVHIDDGETYTSLDNIAVVTVTEDEMDEILESSKISDIVNENRWISLDSVLDRNELNRLRKV